MTKKFKYQYEIFADVNYRGERLVLKYGGLWPSNLKDTDDVADEFDSESDTVGTDFIDFPVEYVTDGGPSPVWGKITACLVNE